MTIKLSIKNIIFVIALIFNASFLISSETTIVEEIKKEEIFKEFLKFIESDCQVNALVCSLSEEIKRVFCKAIRFDEAILHHVLDDFLKCKQEEKRSLESKVRNQCKILSNARKASESGDLLYKKKQEKKYVSKGGYADESFDARLKKDCPEFHEILEVYNYSNDRFKKFLNKKIISSSTDFVSVLRFLDSKVDQINENNGTNSSCPVDPLELVNFFGFPEGRCLFIAQAAQKKIEMKILFEVEKTFSEELSNSNSLLKKHFCSSKDRALNLQKKREEVEEKKLLKSNFFAWMQPIRKRLEQNHKNLQKEKKIKDFEKTMESNYLKSVWSRWQDSKQFQKQLYFEKNVIEPNAKHAEKVELLRTQREAIVMNDDFVKNDNTVKECNDHSDTKISGLSDEQKQANRQARIERRAYRRALGEIFEANTKHQEFILLKRQDRESLAQKEPSPLQNSRQESLLEKKWTHNPYSAVVCKFINENAD